MKDTEVNITINETIFNILNIGRDVEKSEIVEALVKEAEVPQTAIQIKSLHNTLRYWSRERDKERMAHV